MPMGDSAVSSQQPGTGQNRQPGNRDNSGNRARDNIGGNSTVTTTAVAAAIAVNDTVVTIGHTPLCLPPSISKGKNVMFLFGLIQENLLEDMSPTAQLDPDTLKELHDVQIPEVESAIQDCCDAAGKYTSRKGCDTVLVRRAQMVWVRVRMSGLARFWPVTAGTSTTLAGTLQHAMHHSLCSTPTGMCQYTSYSCV